MSVTRIIIALLAFCLWAVPSEATISYRSSTAATFATTTDPVVNAPAGLTDDDLVVITITTTSTDAGGGSPTLNGFTLASGTPFTAQDGNSSQFVLYKLAASEGASWTFTGLFNATTTGTYGVAAYSGVDTMAPVDQVNHLANGITATPTSGSVTCSVDNCMYIGLFGFDPTVTMSATPGATPTFNERVDGSNANGWVYIEDYLQTSAAAVNPTITGVAGVAFNGVSLALAPAAGAGGGGMGHKAVIGGGVF